MAKELTLREAFTMLQNDKASYEKLEQARMRLNRTIIKYFIRSTKLNMVESLNDIELLYYTSFHVKEFPKWLIGIGSNCEKGNDWIVVEFFTQFEDDINKFKPSRSEYVYSDIVSIETLEKFEDNGKADYDWFYEVKPFLKYVQKYPMRAWYVDYYGANFNTEKVSDIKILLKYISHRIYFRFTNKLTEIMDKTFLRFVSDEVLPYCDYNEEYKAYIHVMEDVSPSYYIQCRIPDTAPDEKTGCYDIFYEDEDDPLFTKELKKLEKKWDRKIKHRETIAGFFNHYYWEPLFKDVVFWRAKDWPDKKEE